jgi:hypothetical protein
VLDVRQTEGDHEQQESIMKRMLAMLGVVMLAPIFWASPSLADPGRGAVPLCYFWANEPTASSYSPSPFYSYNEQNRAAGITVTRLGTGVYSVTCTGVGGGSPWGPGGHIQVSAYGAGNPDHCHVAFWGTGGANLTAQVECFAPNGSHADSLYDFLFIW